MDDITARILVVTEATAAQQGIKNTTKSMKELTEARLKDLEIAQKKAKIELLAHEAEKANAQVSFLEKKVKNSKTYIDVLEQYGARVDEMARATKKLEEFTSSLLDAKLKASGLNLDLGVQQEKLRDLEKNAKKGGKGLDEMTKKTVLARIASKLFHADFGNGTARMIAGGAAALGVSLAIKAVGAVIQATDNRLKEMLATAEESIKVAKDYQSSLSEVENRQNSQLSTLEQINGKTVLTAEESLNLRASVLRLGDAFLDAGGAIDSATGKLGNYQKAMTEIKRRQLEDKIFAKGMEIEGLQEKASAQQKKSSSWTTWVKDAISLGGFFYDIRAEQARESNETAREIHKQSRELSRLKQELKIFDEIETKRPKAQEEDASAWISDRLAKSKQEIEMQNLLNAGKEREVEIMKIRNKLDEEERSLTGAKAEAFRKQRAELEKNMLAEYDNRKRIEREKKESKSIEDAAKNSRSFSLERQIVYSAENRRASTRLGGEFGAMATWRAMMNQQQQQRDQKELPKNVTKATNLLEKISISLDRLKETGLIITYS